ncbi:cytochrome P450 [Ceratobasidium sp. AG-I]|nr:cytochrome P450 [Ceratobasidium sp. AG-I]
MDRLEDTARALAGPLVGLLLVIALLAYTWDWPGSRRSDMPPGPRPLPIIGNLLNLKPAHIYDQLYTLHAQFGPIVSLKIGSGTLISIAGNGSEVKQLLDKRGSVYSGRPLQQVTEIAAHGDYVLFQQDINKWRNARKLIVQHFAPSALKSEHFALQEAESVQLLYDFLHLPEKFMLHPMRYVTSVLTCLAFGVRCETYDDPTVYKLQDIMGRMSEIYSPGGKPPVEDIPWLGYIPDFVSPWRIKSREMGYWMEKLYTDLAEVGWQRGREGLNPGNLAYKLRADQEHNGLTQREQAYICGIVLEGGSDIVAAVLLTSLMALVSNPEVQKRAQSEIDGLYDEETLPRWSDEQSLPFVRAVVKETLRWRPPLPVGVFHRLEQDDHYNGYFLPKGSTVICNVWAIHHNSERFDEPEKFKPERFMGNTMSMAESVAQGDHLKRDHFAFGAGRRVCPGIQTAEQDVFIALSRLLWAFDFSVPPGAKMTTDHAAAFEGEAIRQPVQFPLAITPRSEGRVRTIEREMASAKDIYSQYGLLK